jgi:hypothetical protein
VKTVAAIVLILLGAGAGGAPENPNAEQIRKLVAAAWKPSPATLDITFYKTSKDFTKDQAYYQRMYEDAFSDMEGPRENLSPAKAKARDQTVQMNVDLQLLEKEVGRKQKIRLRYSGNRQRTDFVHGIPARTVFKGTDRERTDPGKPLNAETPYSNTDIELTEKDKGGKRYEYSHESRAGTVQTIKAGNSRLFNTMAAFAQWPAGASEQLKDKLSLRTPQGDRQPDESKLELLRSGQLPDLAVTVEPDPDAPQAKVRIQVALGKTAKPIVKVILICDKDDYSKVFVMELRSPPTGNLVLSETRGDYDAQGYPHTISIVGYDGKGSQTSQEFYQIDSVQWNGPIPPEAFQLFDAKAYRVIDRDKSPAEQKEQQIAGYKDWLKDPDWNQRMQGLIWLRESLKDRPEELRSIAIAMQQDPHPQVQKMAEVILRSLEKK